MIRMWPSRLGPKSHPYRSKADVLTQTSAVSVPQKWKCYFKAKDIQLFERHGKQDEIS